LLHVRVHRLVGEEKRERLAALALHVIDGAIGEDVGDIPLHGALLAVFPEDGIDDFALSAEAHPMVVAGARPRVVAHVPFTDMRRFVAQPLQLQVIVGQAMAHRIAPHVIDDAVAARVLPRHDGGAVGRAQRRGMEGVGEARALARDAVDVRRLHVRMTGGAGLVEAQVVDQDDDEVGLHQLILMFSSLTRWPYFS
jgi:hypothetical protein